MARGACAELNRRVRCRSDECTRRQCDLEQESLAFNQPGHQRAALDERLADDRSPLLQRRCLQRPDLSLCRRNASLIGAERGLGRLELRQGRDFVLGKRLRALEGRLRCNDLRLSALKLGDGCYIIVVQRDQFVEIKHCSVGSDLIQVLRRRWLDDLDPALLTRRGVERHDGLTAAVSRHAQWRFDRTFSLGLQRCLASSGKETPDDKPTKASDRRQDNDKPNESTPRSTRTLVLATGHAHIHRHFSIALR